MEKLVRDKMPDICDGSSEYYTPMKYRIAKQAEVKSFLINKLKEEVEELSLAMDSRNEFNIIEELADVQEVLEALEIHLDLGNSVKNKRIEKRAERGAFWRGVIWDGNK